MLLRRGQHALGLLACVGAYPLRLLLRVGTLLGDLVFGLALLRLRLVIGQLENLGDPLADLFVRGFSGERLLADGREFPAQVLGFVQGPLEALFYIPDLVIASRDVLVDLPTAVAAHLHLELFVHEVRQEITIFIHGITRISGPKFCGALSGV
ncbi:MAG: hypothetical protein ACRDN0_25630 [Trebonia sp.]